MNGSTVPDTGRDRIPSLDGLRAVAIICVIWSHLVLTRGFPAILAGHVSLDGNLGVRVFFCISGFIITWLLLREEQRAGSVSLKSFYRRRAARILPACWFYLLVVAVLGYLGFFPIHFAGDILRPLTFTMGLGFWPKTIAWQTAHTWSLAVEEQFYLIWPPLFVLLPRRMRVIAASLVVLAGPLARMEIYLHPQQWGLIWTIVGNADLLAWGCLLALVRADWPSLFSKIVAWRPSIARVIAIVIIQYAPLYFRASFARKYPPLSTNALSFSAQGAATAFLIASLIAVRSGILYRSLNQPIVAGIGLISYSLYLWQELFLADSDRGYLWNRWPVNIACVFAAGIASYFLIQRRGAQPFVAGRCFSK